MTEPLVLVDKSLPGCVLLTLNRPTAMNALSLALRRALVDTLTRLRTDPDARVLVLTGAGKAFCAGLDLKELGATADPTAAVVPAEDQDPVLALSRFAGPVIGAINGVAITGGFELAMACDVLLASTQARFADTHARVGILPGWGLSQKLARMIGSSRAKELSFSGNFLAAAKAEAWGLVNRVAEPDQLLPQALALAGDMLSSDPAMLAAYKRLIDDGQRLSLGDALALEKQRSAEWSATLESGAIEQRRAAIAERGRAQQTKEN